MFRHWIGLLLFSWVVFGAVSSIAAGVWQVRFHAVFRGIRALRFRVQGFRVLGDWGF